MGQKLSQHSKNKTGVQTCALPIWKILNCHDKGQQIVQAIISQLHTHSGFNEWFQGSVIKNLWKPELHTKMSVQQEVSDGISNFWAKYTK